MNVQHRICPYEADFAFLPAWLPPYLGLFGFPLGDRAYSSGDPNNNEIDVAHENKGDLPPPPERNDESGGSGDEFENAVTTAITGVMARAFDHDLSAADHDDVEIIDANLSQQPLTETDDLLEPGFVLNDRFEIVEIVHTGGMSSVYQAVDRRRHLDGSGQIFVAIKMMRRSVAPEHDARLVLEREAARVQRLSHPNIVNVFDFDEHDGRFYLVMEWLDGETVNSLLRRTRGQQLDRAFAWQIIEGTAAGVQHAHFNNVVHADINPSNIFITATHEIKLLDFGVARNCGDRGDIREDRLLWATKAYASPDVLDGMAPVVEDDIFSLGCLAYRLLGGAHPFPDSNVVKAKGDDVAVVPIPGLPEGEWQAIRRALDYSRTNRPKSTAVFFRSTHNPAPTTSEPEEREPARQNWQWLLTTAILVLVVAAGFWWLKAGQAPVAPAQPGTVASEVESPASDVDAAAVAEPAPPVEVSPVAALLTLADEAFADSRYIEPAGDSARDYYREILTIDAADPVALRGLRAISDQYLQAAETALRAGNPADSYAALAVAQETDAANPAIEIVNYLLVAEGNQQLASARAAALSGDTDRATTLLAGARQYQHIDAAAIADVEAQIATQRDEAVLLAQLAVIDQRIASGQLIAPAGDSARDIVLTLRGEHAGNEGLSAATNRLGEELLTSAAMATTAGEFGTAGELLDGVESLGVLQAELDAARSALDGAMTAPEPETEVTDDNTAAVVGAVGAAAAATALDESASAAMLDESASAAAIDETAPAPAAVDESAPPAARADAPGPTATETATAATLAAAAIEPEPAAELEPEPEAAEPQPRRRQSLSELGIQKYVAPKFPRAAQRRELSGLVEIAFVVNSDGTTSEFEIIQSIPGKVFDSSAEKAVRQWRFAPRDEAVEARVTLSFEPSR